MTCSVSIKQIVGKTVQNLNTRFQLHEGFKRKKIENNIAWHFSLEICLPSYTIKIEGQEEGKHRRVSLEVARLFPAKGLNLKLQ